MTGAARAESPRASAPVGNVVDYLLEHSGAAAHANRIAHRLDDRDVTYGALAARVSRAGNALKRLGLAPGDRVMMSVADGPDFVATFLGGMKMGAVTLPINTMLKAKDYLYYLNDSEAKAVVIDAALAPVIDEIKPQLKTVRHILVAGARVPGTDSFDDALAAESDQLETLPRGPDDMAFWLYSSGSTGDPKGVVHTHAHIYWATELFGLAMMKIAADDVIVCPPRMFFAYGLGNQVYFPIRAGAAVVVNQGPITPRRVWDLWLKHEPTIVMSVPTLFAGQMQIAEQELGQARVRQACGRLRFSVCGGEILPPALYRRWKDFTGTEILDAIGTTEMTHMFTFNRPGDAMPGSCGKIVDGYRYEILDGDGKPVPKGEIGNLHVMGPTAAAQYWNKPEKTREVMGRGGVMTGDKVYEDPHGNIFLVGRSDDMLRVGAIWVSPAEVENALATHPDVLECAVVGHPDEHQMIKPKAFVVLRDPARGSAALEAEMKEHLRATLAHIKCPRWIEFVGELPKTATGKIQRFRLRAASG
ncbi:MAG: benzoate-CoA ligase family protein [Rhodospirillaceae bacterium]|nr:benzoate-CoA ligase family protein [Rhodospirillaceae bacterium]